MGIMNKEIVIKYEFFNYGKNGVFNQLRSICEETYDAMKEIYNNKACAMAHCIVWGIFNIGVELVKLLIMIPVNVAGFLLFGIIRFIIFGIEALTKKK